MTNERYVFTETVTRTVEAEGKENVERLQTLVEKRGVPMNPVGEPSVTERSEAPAVRAQEPAPPEAPEERVEATAETLATDTDKPGETGRCPTRSPARPSTSAG